MNKLFFLTLLALTFLTSCSESIKGEGDAGFAQDFKVEPFDGINAKGKFKIVLIPNDSAYVSVQSHKNLIENMDIYVQNEELYINEKENVDSFESYVIYLYYNQNLTDISIGNKILMESSSTLNFDNIDIMATDEALIRQFVIKAKEAKITARDKAEISISGNATTLNLKGKNYATLNLEALNVKVLDVDLGGECEVFANVSKELEGRVIKNATLNYIGSPQKDVDVKDNGEILNK